MRSRRLARSGTPGVTSRAVRGPMAGKLRNAVLAATIAVFAVLPVMGTTSGSVDLGNNRPVAAQVDSGKKAPKPTNNENLGELAAVREDVKKDQERKEDAEEVPRKAIRPPKSPTPQSVARGVKDIPGGPPDGRPPLMFFARAGGQDWQLDRLRERSEKMNMRV